MNFFHRINYYLDTHLGSERSKVFRHRFDTSWAIISIIVVVFLICSSLYMLIQQPVIVEVKSPRDQLPVVQLTPNSSSYISSPIGFNPKLGKASYEASLVDVTGKTVFIYPKIVLDKMDHSNVGAGGLSFRIPDITPGTYYLNALIRYPLNPIKDASLSIEIARVVITPKQDPDSLDQSGSNGMTNTDNFH